MVIFFFFQAEDGIRDADVTGVQTLLFRSRRASQLAEDDAHPLGIRQPLGRVMGRRRPPNPGGGGGPWLGPPIQGGVGRPVARPPDPWAFAPTPKVDAGERSVLVAETYARVRSIAR